MSRKLLISKLRICVGVEDKFSRKALRSSKTVVLLYVIWSGILRWLQILNQNFSHAYAFWEISDLKNLRGRIQKFYFLFDRS